MEFKERQYSILVVSAAQNARAMLRSLLCVPTYAPRFVSDLSAAKREIADRSYDFVLINAPLPDGPGVRFAMDTVATPGTVTLLLVRGDDYDGIYEKVTPAGVFTLAKPVSRSTLEFALHWMIASRERMRGMEKKSLSIEEKMEEIRLVNRAKWLLIDNLKMTEADAHRYIEKLAMDRCVTRREVATGIITTYT